MRLSESAGEKLAQFLLEAGQISYDQLRQAESASREGGKKVMELLIEYGHTSEPKIIAAIRKKTGVDIADEEELNNIPQDVIHLLSSTFVLQNRIFPLSQSENEIRVALSEPSSLSQINGIRTLLNQRISPAIVGLSRMDQFLDMLDGTASNKTSQKSKPAEPKAKPSAPAPVTTSDTGANEVVNFVNNLLTQAVSDKASDIHIETFKDSARVRVRMDGVLHPIDKSANFLFRNYAAVTTRIKILANLDIAERRLPQDGAIVMTMPNGNEVDFRVSVLPTSFGERVVMRILDRNAMSLDLADLGIPPDEMKKFNHAIESPQGMVLVTGPTGSGKTTTLYGALRCLNQPGINILTAEDPVEFSIEGLGQVHVREDIGLTFASALRSFLRQDPEIILVGEIRDRETADISIKAALTGHLVLSTLHTNDALSTITRLINMGIPSYLIAASLTAIVAQRLARKICEHCKDKDAARHEKALLALGFPAEKIARIQPYAGVGCSKCSHTGYKGRIGIYEVLPIGDTLRAAITANADFQTLRKIAVEDGFRSMQENGRELIAQGTLSVAEYERNLLFN